MIRTTAVLGLLLMVGCSFTAPTARVVSVEPDSITDEGTRVLVTIELENPNDVEVPLPRAYYRVTLDGAEPFAFDTLPTAALPPNGMQRVTLPAAFALDRETSVAERGYDVSGSITYQPPGAFRALMTQYGVPLPKAGFSESGTMSAASVRE